MRAYRDAHRVQNLYQHQHHQKLVQHPQGLDRDRPVAQAIPEQPASTRDGHQCRNEKQDGEYGINDHLGFAQIVPKVMPNFVFDHLGGMVPPEADNAALIYPPVLTPLQQGHLDPEQASMAEPNCCWKSPDHSKRLVLQERSIDVTSPYHSLTFDLYPQPRPRLAPLFSRPAIKFIRSAPVLA